MTEPTPPRPDEIPDPAAPDLVPPPVHDIPTPPAPAPDIAPEPVPDVLPEPPAPPAPPAFEVPPAEAPLLPPPGAVAPAVGAFASPPPAQWPAGSSYPAVAAPVAAPATGQTSSNAIIALILAVGAWAVCPIILAVVALVFANMATKEISASGGRVQGGGLVTAAKIVAWVNIGLVAAAIIVGVFVLILVAIAGSTS